MIKTCSKYFAICAGAPLPTSKYFAICAGTTLPTSNYFTISSGKMLHKIIKNNKSS